MVDDGDGSEGYPVDQGIPLSPRRRTSESPYPFASMAIQESFVYLFTVRAGHKLVSRANKAFKGERVFTSRQQEDGLLRIWRVK